MMELFDAIDEANIIASIGPSGEGWTDKRLETVKRKIKNHLRTTINEQCCYCRRDTKDEFNMVLDIEHVLPQSLYRTEMFELFNLSVSCKRCNMQYKKEKIDFLISHPLPAKEFKSSPSYKLIHPNLDDYYVHLKYTVQIEDNTRLVKYTVKNRSRKGQYTYDFFNLEGLERDCVSLAQGSAPKQELSPKISDARAERIRKALSQL